MVIQINPGNCQFEGKEHGIQTLRRISREHENGGFVISGFHTTSLVKLDWSVNC